MDSIIPIVVIALFLFLFTKRIKIPKGLKPVPALEIEFPINYEASVSINGGPLITLPVTDDMIEDYKRDKGQLSKSSKVLKYQKESKSSFELLLNLSDTLSLSNDSFSVDITYKKVRDIQPVRDFGELDYALAYIHDGKLLLDSDIQEKNVKLDDEGQVSITFDNLSEKARQRMDRLS